MPKKGRWKASWMRCLLNNSSNAKSALEVQILIMLLTNPNQKMLPIAKAKELYFKRWGVETAVDLRKSKPQLENFCGKSVIAIQQNFSLRSSIHLSCCHKRCKTLWDGLHQNNSNHFLPVARSFA
ncbi:MAG: hypothetical protein RR301_07425 [Clostridia bacterium]